MFTFPNSPRRSSCARQDKTRQDPVTDEFMDLRSRAEAAIQEKAIDSPDVSTLPTQELQALVHELQVHQIEMEMQNDELKTVQLALEEARDKYQELYDSVPVGHFTLTHKGIIKEVNRTGAILLGMSRSKLINMRFGHFVVSESDDQWYQHIISALGHEEKQSCVLTLQREDGSSFYARLESVQQVAPVELRNGNGGTLVVNMAVTDITERKVIEEALKKSEERHRTLVEHLPQRIFVKDRNSVYVSCNENYASDLGITPEQIVGKDDFAFHGPERAEAYRADDQACMATGMVKDLRESYHVADQERWIHTIKVPYHDSQGRVIGVLGIFEDITERRRTEHALRESEGRFRAMFENHSAVMLLIDPVTGKIVDANMAAERFYGYTMSQLRSMSIQEINVLPPDELEAQRNLALKEQRNHFIFPHRLANGEVKTVEVHSAPIEQNGTNILFSIIHDITERKRLEEERIEMQHKLHLAQKFQSLAVMAGGIAHDFNNLLMAILGNLEFALTDRGLGAEGKKAIAHAIEATDRSAELSHQMLIYSGKLFYVPKVLDLCELAHKNEDLLKLYMPKTTTLHFQIHKGHLAIRGDEDQIQRVITNLVINASEAIGENTGDVTLATGAMDCDAAYLSRCRLEEKPEPGEFVFVQVTDTGCGMDAETQHKLFDPFFTTKFWGRGLGMAEVMGIVKGHHGNMMVESEIGKGTTIRVLFPVSKKPQALPVQVNDFIETKAPASESVSRRKTVLVVDDEELVRGLVLKRLEVLGYDTIAAVDGEEGVHLFSERLNEIDLVLLDFAMPKMNGVEAFGELIQIRPDVKAILSSGYTEDVVAKSFPGPKPAGFLSKPYKMEELKGELERLLGTRDGLEYI